MELTVYVGGVALKPFDADENGVCETVALRESAERSWNWSDYEKDKASALLRAIFQYRSDYGGMGRLLLTATTAMMQAAVGPVCKIEGRDQRAVYPELRWCNFALGVACYRAGAEAPLTTRQFEQHREYLEQLWRGPVAIEVGTVIGAPPGSVVVRQAPANAIQQSAIPLSLPERIPLVLEEQPVERHRISFMSE